VDNSAIVQNIGFFVCCTGLFPGVLTDGFTTFATHPFTPNQNRQMHQDDIEQANKSGKMETVSSSRSARVARSRDTQNLSDGCWPLTTAGAPHQPMTLCASSRIWAGQRR